MYEAKVTMLKNSTHQLWGYFSLCCLADMEMTIVPLSSSLVT